VKKNILFIPVLASEAGTSRFSVLLSITVFALSSFAFLTTTSSCTMFTQSQDNDDLQSQQQNQDDDDSDYASDDSEEDDDGMPKFPMPQRPEKWYTRMLVATHPQPEADDVANCMDSVTIAAEDAQNSQDMIQAQYQLANSVEQGAQAHHWCFFQIIVGLDDRLGKGGALMTDTADDFFVSMRQLWILGRSLDNHRGGSKYFDYVRTRYLQINKDIFGRDVMVMGRPMGNVRAMPKFEKSAGKAPTEGEEGPDKIKVDANKVRVSADDYQQDQDYDVADEGGEPSEEQGLNEATPAH
jgi:hypothetical protein